MKQWSFMLFCVYMMMSSVNFAFDTDNNNAEPDKVEVSTSAKLWEIKNRCVNACSQICTWLNEENEDTDDGQEITDSLLIPILFSIAMTQSSNQ